MSKTHTLSGPRRNNICLKVSLADENTEYVRQSLAHSMGSINARKFLETCCGFMCLGEYNGKKRHLVPVTRKPGISLTWLGGNTYLFVGLINTCKEPAVSGKQAQDADEKHKAAAHAGDGVFHAMYLYSNPALRLWPCALLLRAHVCGGGRAEALIWP